MLYNSVQSSSEDTTALTNRIDNNVRNHCCIDYASDCIMHCHIISKTDVKIAIGKLKSDKINEGGVLFSDNFIHGTNLYEEIHVIIPWQR